MLLASAWYIVIRSYCQLNSGKFQVLLALEEKLAYPFFKREWELLGEGKDSKSYRKLTGVETFVPVIFGILPCEGGAIPNLVNPQNPDSDN